MHLGVAGTVSTLAAGRIHNDFAACISGRRIVGNRAALQLEGAMHGVQRGIQGPPNDGLGRVKMNLDGLLARRSCRQQTQAKEKDGCSKYSLATE